MLSLKTLREHLLPISPQAAIEHWMRVFEMHAENPDFENPRVVIYMKSGATFSGYMVSVSGQSNSGDRYLILSLVEKQEPDQARDIVYLNYSDVESIAFFNIDHVIQYLARK
jgi:hypothetical protein